MDKKVDEVLDKKHQRVKAIRTYNSEFTVHATDEIGQHKQGVKEIQGEGPPKLRVDLKRNDDRGEEIDLLFYGKREIRENFNPESARNWVTFGQIILSPEQAKNFVKKLAAILEMEKIEAPSMADLSPDKITKEVDADA